MRTVEQLEKALMPEDSTKCEMSNELLATLGIKPLKSILITKFVHRLLLGIFLGTN